MYRAEVVLNGKTYTNDQKEIIPATGHKYNKAPVFKWSEDKKTCVAEFKCTTCSNVQQVPCTVSFEETKKATCEKDGEAVYTASCKFDGKGYVNVKTVTVKATGHEYGEAAFTWSKDYKTCTAKATCKTCGKTVTKTCKVSKVDSKEATDTEDGYCQYRAEVVLNGKTYTDDKKEVIPAKGHQYGNPKFVWSKDYQSCVLKLTCADCKDVKEIECTVTSKGTKATCTKNGKVVYTAVGAFYGKEYKDSKTVAVKATGHDFDKNGVCKNCKIQMLKSVSSAGKNMTVSWEKVSKANGYYVYRSTDGKKFTKVKTITSGNTVKFNDTKANKNGQKYVYKIVAYTKDNNGKETVIVTTKKTKTGYFLSTPKVTSVKNQKGAKAVVAWTTNKKASGYQIEYTVSGGKSQTMTVSAKNKNATLKNLKKKKIYTIRVRSYKTVSNTKYYSAWSSKKVAVKATGHDFDKNGVCKNCKIQMLKSVSSAGKNMTVSWEKVSKANGYYVYRSTDGKKFTKVKTITSGNTVKFNDTKANKNGQKYVYKIVAYTKDNNGKETVIVTTKKTKTGYFLSTPKVTSVKNQKGAKAVVAWTTNKKASGYQIEYTVSGGKSQTMTVSAKNKNATLKNLKKKKIYTIRVRSYKTVSNTKYYSAWSSKKSVKVNK